MRLRRWPKVPRPDPESGVEARRAVSEAVHRLGDALSRDAEVTDRARKLEKIHRENNLGPRISAALGVHSG